MSDSENFWADVRVEQTEEGKWFAVLVVGQGEPESGEDVRIPLEGTFDHPEAAREAAMDAIAAMALGSDESDKG
ncbi:hypothetical protein [Roseateles noduli]|uniref:hypothetical protein n=1 Tax=Roseateles noduli TaxID=2052484 RepID=UPI003D65F5AF